MYLIISISVWLFALFVVLPMSAPVAIVIMIVSIISDIHYFYKGFKKIGDDLHKELYDER